MSMVIAVCGESALTSLKTAEDIFVFFVDRKTFYAVLSKKNASKVRVRIAKEVVVSSREI